MWVALRREREKKTNLDGNQGLLNERNGVIVPARMGLLQLLFEVELIRCVDLLQFGQGGKNELREGGSGGIRGGREHVHHRGVPGSTWPGNIRFLGFLHQDHAEGVAFGMGHHLVDLDALQGVLVD